MKRRFAFSKSKALIALAAVALTTVAWSPTGTDRIVELAPGSTSNYITATEPSVVVGSTNRLNASSDGTYAAATTGRGIVVGTGNKFGSSGSTAGGWKGYAMTVGDNNKTVGRSTLVVGWENTVTPNAVEYTDSVNYSAIFGFQNMLATGGNNALLVSGTTNTVLYANSSFVAGTNNTLGGLTSGGKSYSSAAIGNSNLVGSTAGWALGAYNTVSADNGVAIGKGAKADQPNTVGLGRYNASMATDDVMVVGTGTDDTHRNTALRVTSDGSVVLGRAQGDISMGGYGN